MNGRNKELRKLIKQLEAQGWRVEKGGHWKLFAPDGKSIVVVSSSPKSTETHKVRADCVRAGAVFD